MPGIVTPYERLAVSVLAVLDLERSPSMNSIIDGDALVREQFHLDLRFMLVERRGRAARRGRYDCGGERAEDK